MYLKNLDPKGAENLSLVKNYLFACRKGIKMIHDNGGTGREVVNLRTTVIDGLLCDLFNLAGREFCLRYSKVDQKCTVVALGGYGRKELSPASDIDIMFLYPRKVTPYVETVIERILYILWDTGLDVGYSARNVADCVKISSDLVAKTSLIDSRFICGDTGLYGEYEKTLRSQILSRNVNQFIEEKVREGEERKRRYGGSVYILEPDIKEGDGGLRDLHTALWAAKVKYRVDDLDGLVEKEVIGGKEYEEIVSAYDFMLRIRNDLHFQVDRKSDQLTFDLQEKIAENLGYRDMEGALAVEQLMKDYYMAASSIKENSEIILDRCMRRERRMGVAGFITARELVHGFKLTRGELTISDGELFKKTPETIMKLFELSQLYGVAISSFARDRLRESLDLIDDDFRSSREVNESFMNILRSEWDVAGTLKLMHKMEVLGRYIPEFGEIRCQVQHDVYHIYTVDTHSLFAVEELRKLTLGEYREEYPIRTTLMKELEKPEVLYIAALLHDVGKGRGGRHEEIGAEIAARVAARIGFPESDVKDIEFLVLKHLRLSHTAQRRDLHDPKLILDFAREMGTLERLKMLYLLTYADIKAIGPDVWNDWKSALFLELYLKTAEVFEKGSFELGEREERIAELAGAVGEIMGEECSADAIDSVLRSMPDRYLFSNSASAVADHIRAVLGHRGSLRIDVQHNERRGYSRLIITTLDVPGLFSMISGVLAANGINILGAQIYTRKGGEVLDVFHVNSSQGTVVKDPDKWRKVESDLLDVIHGVRKVDDIVREQLKPSILGKRYRPEVKPQVVIDNETSDANTIIEVFAEDRIGLLYSLTSTITRLGLYIDVAKISTMGNQVTDVFYVKDIFGQKIYYDRKLEEIKKELLMAAEGEIGEGGSRT